MMKLIVFAFIAAIGAFAWMALPGPDQAQAPQAGKQVATGNGVVHAVDRENGVVTIRHGPLPALNMMPMTMSYIARDRSQLAALRPMQDVEFRVAFDGSQYLILDIK